MPAEANERLIGECLCGADGWRKELRCARTEWCTGGLRRREAEAPAADDAVLMAVLSGNAPAQVEGVLRLHRSARALGSQLPFHAILCGVSDATLQRVEREHIVAHRWPAPRAPAWANPVHRPSFAKLLLFNASTGRTVIYLDTDVVLLQNIDELATAPAPAFVFKKKELLNSGVAVFRSTAAERDALWRHFRGMMAPSYKREREGGDQEVLLSFWQSQRTTVHELPIEYNAYGWEMNASAQPHWWMHTRVAHKLPGVTPMPASQEKAWQTRVPSQARSYLVARATALLRHPARGTGPPPAIVDPTAGCHHGMDLRCCRRHPRACTGVLKSVKKAEPHHAPAVKTR